MLMGLLLALIGLLMFAAVTPHLVWWSVHPASGVLVAVYLYGMRPVASSGELPIWHAQMIAETNDGQTRAPAASGSMSWLWIRFF